MRYRLRTLLILLAILPPLLWVGWGKYQAWRAEQERQKAIAAELARQQALNYQQAVQAFFTAQPQPMAPAKAGE